MKNGWLPSDYSDGETVDLISNSCYRESQMPFVLQTSPFMPSGSFSFGLVCVGFVLLGSVVALAASFWREARRRRRFNYINIGETVPATQVYPQYVAFPSWATMFGGGEGKTDGTGAGEKERVERARKEGTGGIDEESKGEREVESREVQSSKEKNLRANKSTPSIIQMTEIPYQQ